MSVRSTLRSLVYRLLRHPSSEVTLTARCMSGDGCRWELDATNDLDAGSIAIMSHTAETGHGLFTRRVEDVAVVVLNNEQEQACRGAVNRLELVTSSEARREAAEETENARADHR
ncbi:hypothetical protein [Streptomyces sp. CBMA152]|uniref:hypothetical protein n=1 Tax=Streptomyces sp. CBMA152 TaxID=1896312 RepID=UPI0016616504|nr:hypothetical protein [Streptomyces sp. CBMA152]MBD0747347.1 hypothetical protein [Streptomyces sp. CBMA152]